MLLLTPFVVTASALLTQEYRRLETKRDVRFSYAGIGERNGKLLAFPVVKQPGVTLT